MGSVQNSSKRSEGCNAAGHWLGALYKYWACAVHFSYLNNHPRIPGITEIDYICQLTLGGV